MKRFMLGAFLICAVFAARTARATDFTCTPINVASFASHVHVQCNPGTGTTIYFAVSAANAGAAERFVNIGLAAIINNKTLIIQYGPPDASFGCLVKDCRPATAILIKK